MATYKSADGATFTDEDLERWGNEAETGVPYDGKHLGSSVAGARLASVLALSRSPSVLIVLAARSLLRWLRSEVRRRRSSCAI